MTEHAEQRPLLTLETLVRKPVALVWACWTKPEHIVNWNFAGDDWCCPCAENDLKPGGRYLARMEARDGSFGFDFGWTYEDVEPLRFISGVMDDGRILRIEFTGQGEETRIVESFEAEGTNSLEMQRQGWGMILERFRMYVEAL